MSRYPLLIVQSRAKRSTTSGDDHAVVSSCCFVVPSNITLFVSRCATLSGPFQAWSVEFRSTVEIQDLAVCRERGLRNFLRVPGQARGDLERRARAVADLLLRTKHVNLRMFSTMGRY